MDIIPRVIRWVELYDPVNTRNVESSGSDVCAQEDACLSVDKLEEGIRSFLLLLLALRTLSVASIVP